MKIRNEYYAQNEILKGLNTKQVFNAQEFEKSEKREAIKICFYAFSGLMIALYIPLAMASSLGVL